MAFKDDLFTDINLQTLSRVDGYRTNIAVIRKVREHFEATTLDRLKSELRSLEGLGLVTIDETGPILVVELTEQGRVLVEGWSKPKNAGGTGPNSPTAAQWRLLEDRARQVGYSGLADPRFLDRDGARRVIAALGNWINRNSGKTQKGESK